jgi:response regulator RpfG family c-di-GMP phosphodiesterase
MCLVTAGFTDTTEFSKRFAHGEWELKNRPLVALETAQMLQNSQNPVEQGLAHALACRANLELGQWVQALRHGSQAVALLLHPKHRADAQVGLGLCLLPLGEYNAALETFSAAHQTYLELGDMDGVVECAARLTRLQLNLGQLEQAQQLAQYTLEQFAFRSLPEHRARLLFEIAHTETQLYQHNARKIHKTNAESHIEHCLETARQANMPELLEQLQYNLAPLYGLLDEATRAETELRHLYDMALEQANPKHQMSCLINLGHFAMQRNDLTVALERTEAALKFAQAQENREALLHCYNNLWQIQEQRGDFRAALEAHKQHHHISMQLRNQNAERRAQMFSAQLELQTAKNESELHRVRSIELEQRVLERTSELERAQLEMLERLAMAAEYRDYDTGLHTQRVGECAAKIAEQLLLPPSLVEQIRLAARLHDIGKISIPDSILLNRGELLPEQWQVIRAHTEVGARMLSGSQSPLIQLAEEIALTHHERFNGSGYPKGLVGHDIPLSGRITAVADVFDALLSERPYKHAWTQKDALDEIARLSGSHFDPMVVQAFLRCFTVSSSGAVY